MAASGLLEAFKKIWADSWGPRLEHIMRNALLALLDQPQATLADVLRLLDDQTFRKGVAAKVSSAQVRNFWLREYENYPARFRMEAVAPIQNKVGAFLANPVMLLGALLVTRLGLAALSRADTPEEDRRDFYLYLDEFHNFTTLSLAIMLSELRKYRVNMIFAHQYMSQLDVQVRDAILGNVGTIISFRIGVSDAEILAKEFYPEFSLTDLINPPNYHIYLRLIINGVVCNPFSAQTKSIGSMEAPTLSPRQTICWQSLNVYTVAGLSRSTETLE